MNALLTTFVRIQNKKNKTVLFSIFRATNGDVKIFSSQHVTGESLAQLTGVAAILRFPCPEIDDTPEDEVDAALIPVNDADDEEERPLSARSD